MRYLVPAVLCSAVFLLAAGSVSAQETLDERVTRLESELSSTKNRLNDVDGEGLTLFLYAVFCALWAQNTGRSALLWFFLGLFFSFFTVFVLLYKNSTDNRARGERLLV